MLQCHWTLHIAIWEPLMAQIIRLMGNGNCAHCAGQECDWMSWPVHRASQEFDWISCSLLCTDTEKVLSRAWRQEALGVWVWGLRSAQ